MQLRISETFEKIQTRFYLLRRGWRGARAPIYLEGSWLAPCMRNVNMWIVSCHIHEWVMGRWFMRMTRICPRCLWLYVSVTRTLCVSIELCRVTYTNESCVRDSHPVCEMSLGELCRVKYTNESCVRDSRARHKYAQCECYSLAVWGGYG